MQGLIDEDGGGSAMLEGELSLVFEKWAKLSTSSMKNMIFDAKVNLGCGGYEDNILKLKKGSRYDYIHDSCFPRQVTSSTSLRCLLLGLGVEWI